ncbi:transcriptional regulator [Candidatus Bathyarchaeota archaeon]|jgi:predicted transcriptional regulator|nr:transcriptional regulator [Candidatus Bathyarchaeota archaeon]
MSGKRSDMEISADILKVTVNGALKSHIVYKANINFQLGKKYLDRLTNSGLIVDSVNGSRVYFTTDKGREYIKQFEDLKELASWDV